MYALNLDKETGRVLSATYPEYAPAHAVMVEQLPEGDISEYIYQQGEYVHSPAGVDEEEETVPTLEQRVSTLESSNAEIAEALNMILTGVTE